MDYVVKINSDRVIQDFRREDDDYKITAREEVLLSRKMFIILSTAYKDSNNSLIIKVKESVSEIKSLDDIYLLNSDGTEAVIKIYLCGYQDSGPMLRLVTVRESNNREKYNEQLFIPITHDVYDALSNYRDVIRQGTVYSLKSNGVISVEDLKIVNNADKSSKPLTQSTVNSPESHRATLELKAKDLLVSRLNVSILMDMYQFILLNNRLANNGVHPTPDNISRLISESQNDVNKSLLQQISVVMDKLQEYNDIYLRYNSFVSKIKNTDDTQQMSIEYNQYLRQFQS